MHWVSVQRSSAPKPEILTWLTNMHMSHAHVYKNYFKCNKEMYIKITIIDNISYTLYATPCFVCTRSRGSLHSRGHQCLNAQPLASLVRPLTTSFIKHLCPNEIFVLDILCLSDFEMNIWDPK